LGVSRTKRDAASGVTLVLIPPGEFTMGSSQAERDQMLKLYKDLTPEDFADEKLHPVRITQPFYLGAHEVTVGQFRRFVTATGYKTDAEKDGEGGSGWNETEGQFEVRKPQYSWRNPGFPQTEEHPVVNVSWRDAVAFCEWLGRQDGGTYRLPREAEWEYACRAGSPKAFWNGDDVESLATIGNITDASAKAKWKNLPDWPYVTRSDGFVFTAPVGNYPFNGFGLYDMHGNVWEWCSDWYGEYPDVAESDPEGPMEGSSRVFRGGGWFAGAANCRTAFRSGGTPAGRGLDYGFRLALSFVEVPTGSGQDQKK
jgi:formylglycine-generating enzyme required for sulfatase activity